MRPRLAVAVVVILVVAIGVVAIAAPRGGQVSSLTESASVESSSTAGQSVTSAVQSVPVAYAVNGTFVSRFCSNSSAIPLTGDAAASLVGTGAVGTGPSVLSVGWNNTGGSPVQIAAVCVEAVGFVAANATDEGLITDASATTIQLDVSPSNPVQPGQEANTTAIFTGGSGVYYMPQGGLTCTVIAADGSTTSLREPQGGGFTTTATAPAPIVSLRGASLLSGSVPTLSAALSFNSTSQIEEVDFLVNGTYIGTAGVGHDTLSPGAPDRFSVSYELAIDGPGRLSVVRGDAYVLTFVAAAWGSLGETTVSTTVVAG